ncbi:MFS monocarboxylate transporter protein [Rutstroemia sp. NJR-2017a BVV2]|nr:MFS monocarboxylate transporter protein [Rutstroemia sp. NJR-2017a BVV2]
MKTKDEVLASEVPLVALGNSSTAGREKKQPQAVDPIPDGGLIAWLQCASSFCLFFNCWGIVNTFEYQSYGYTDITPSLVTGSVFQTFYEQSLLRVESSSNISWIGSVQAFLLIFLGIITGPLFDHGYLRTLLFAGTVSVSFGMMMTSLCTSYWQVVLSQGIVVGLGCGCLFVPSVAILPSYFSTRKSLAMGIGASGSSLGALFLHYVWLDEAETLLSCWPPYIGLFCTFMGLYVPFFYVQTYVIQQGIMSENLGFYLLAILNAGSFFGRIILNHLADKVGPLNICIACGIFTSVLGFAWIGIKSPIGIIIFSILYGYVMFFYSSFPPLPRLFMGNTRFSWSTKVSYKNQVLLGPSGFTSSSRCRDPFSASRSDWSPPWDAIFAHQLWAADR